MPDAHTFGRLSSLNHRGTLSNYPKNILSKCQTANKSHANAFGMKSQGVINIITCWRWNGECKGEKNATKNKVNFEWHSLIERSVSLTLALIQFSRFCRFVLKNHCFGLFACMFAELCFSDRVYAFACRACLQTKSKKKPRKNEAKSNSKFIDYVSQP